MRICHVAHGSKQIPPKAWGAVESIISDYKVLIENLGHEFYIINTKDQGKIIREIDTLAPDVVHIHNETWWELAGRVHAPVLIVCTHQGSFFQSSPETQNIRRSVYEQGFKSGDFFIHCISDRILEYFLNLGISSNRLFLIKNGARSDLFRCTNSPRHPRRSICVGKITRRKRQYMIQDLDFIDFVGPKSDSWFDYTKPNYLGEWKRPELYSDLTEYANLVLLSRSEAAPLVTCEALMAGLGVVVTENAAANLDRSQPFIEIIPEKRIKDLDYVRAAILKNQRISIGMRLQIRSYGVSQFDWKPIVQEYVEKLTGLLKTAYAS